jgi:hypothetical protein
MMKRLSLVLLPAALLLVAGCSSEGDPLTTLPTPSPTATARHTTTSTTTASFTATATLIPTRTATASATPTLTATLPQSGAVALFRADPSDPANPFPSDRLLDESGHVSVSGALIGADLPPTPDFDMARGLSEIVARQLTALTGFSTFAPIRVKLDKPIAVADPMTHEGILVFEFDDPSADHPVRVRTVTPDVAGDTAVEIYPVIPFREETRYVYVLTRALRDLEQNSLRPSADLTAALTGEGAGTSWRATLTPVLQHLSTERSIAVEDIAAIDFFTTQSITDDLVAIRDHFLDGRLPPAEPVFENSPVRGLDTGIFAEGTPQFTDLIGSATSDTVAAVAIGSFPSYDFRTGANGAFDPARISLAVTPAAPHLDFYLTIPKAPPPPGGYPITIFGHGLGGNGRNAVAVSQLIGDAPMMGIGISAVEHGRRGNVANFFVLTNGFISRERFRQTVADLLQLARMLRNTNAPPFDQVDKDRIQYFGVSLGGIMGSLFMALDPDVTVGMLSVPGGGLPNILQSEAIGNLLNPLISLTVGIPVDDVLFPVFLHRFVHLSQWFIDAGDPINLAPYIGPAGRLPRVPPKRILMHEGVIDNVVPNSTTDDLARAMGLADAKASGGCESVDGCSGVWRFVMTEYGEEELSGHGVTFTVPQASEQAARFLTSGGQEIIDASP